MSNDDPFSEYDAFEGDDEFREIVVGNRDECETRRVVVDLDAKWFKENPQFRYRIRRYVPGEFDSASGGFCGDADDFVVLVTRGGGQLLFPLGTFDGRGWRAGGLK